LRKTINTWTDSTHFTTKITTLEKAAALDFEPWQDVEFKVPTLEEIADPHLILCRLAYGIMNKSKPQLVQSFADGATTILPWIGLLHGRGPASGTCPRAPDCCRFQFHGGRMMTTGPETCKARMSGALAQAIARHKAAQAALDAVPGPEDYPEYLSHEEDEALDELAFTPCASDAEFLEKLRYLYVQQAKIWDLPDNGDDYGCIVIAAACHFCPVNA
jgi:hypothetical protein